MKLSEIFQNVYIYKIHLDSCSGQILQKFPCSSSVSKKSLQLKKLAQRTRGEESGREFSGFSVWRVQIWNLTSRLKPMCSWMRWSNAVISAAFRSFPPHKSKWMRTEQINSARLNRGLNYMQRKVIGCDGELLVFLRSPVAHASPRGGPPFCLFPKLSHFRNLAEKTDIPRVSWRSWGGSRGLRAQQLGGGLGVSVPCWRRCSGEPQSQMWAGKAARKLRSATMDVSKTWVSPLDLHLPELQRYLDIEWSLHPTGVNRNVNRSALTCGGRGFTHGVFLFSGEKRRV